MKLSKFHVKLVKERLRHIKVKSRIQVTLPSDILSLTFEVPEQTVGQVEGRSEEAVEGPIKVQRKTSNNSSKITWSLRTNETAKQLSERGNSKRFVIVQALLKGTFFTKLVDEFLSLGL
ncbi:MAG: hypothetical protein K2P88_14410 [Chitinophagaceae bacterium]|nr:hypothetical protein [Chitinophagaceae bacterium]